MDQSADPGQKAPQSSPPHRLSPPIPYQALQTPPGGAKLSSSGGCGRACFLAQPGARSSGLGLGGHGAGETTVGPLEQPSSLGHGGAGGG
jgi:hypothetical protein